eukprot:jgi/Mesvir1/28083/Mv04674-RA.1
MASQTERRAGPPSFAASILLLTTKEGAEAKLSSSMRSFSQDPGMSDYGHWSTDGHRRPSQSAAAAKDNGALRRAVKEVEELLRAHRPIATQWRGKSSHFSVLLEDASWVHCNLRATSGDDIEWLCTDRSEATIIPDKIISADMDEMGHLLLSLSRTGMLQVYDLKHRAVEAIHGANVNMDTRTKLASAKVDSLSVGEGVRSVHLNCSADLAMVLCESSVVVYRIRQERDGKGGKAKGPRLVCAIQQPMLVKDVVQCRFSHRLPNVVILTSAPNAPTAPALGAPGAAPRGSGKEQKAPPAAEMGQYIVSRGKITAVRQMVLSAADLPGGASAAEWDLEESQLVVGSRDGHLVLYDVARGVLRKVHFPDKGKVKLLRWHPSGAFLFVGFSDGSVAAVDAALNTLWFAFEGLGMGQPCLSFTDMLGFDCQVSQVDFYGAGKGQGRNMDAVAGLNADELTYTLWERSVVVMERGPLAVVSLAMGALSQGKLRVREVVAQHLNNGDIRQAISLVSVCNHDTEKLCALELIMNQTMRLWAAPSLMHRFPLQETIWSVLELANLPRGNSFPEQWRNLWRRVGQHLLRFNQLEAAFSLAHRIQGIDLLQVGHCGGAGLAGCRFLVRWHALGHYRPLRLRGGC